MKVILTGVHPNTYDGSVKNELLQINFPTEVTAIKKFYIEEEEEEYIKWIVYLPNEPDYVHAAWFLTDNEEINKWITNYWNDAKSTDTKNNQG